VEEPEHLMSPWLSATTVMGQHLDPAGRSFYQDWDKAANSCVAELQARSTATTPIPRGSPKSSTRSA
jgi:hypothetical protein